MNIDNTIINIVSLELGLGIVIVALWSFHSPHLHKSFYGTNLFAMKRDLIHSHQAAWFAAATAVLVLLQVSAEVGAFTDRRLHPPIEYMGIALALLPFGGVSCWSLSRVALHFARRKWVPEVLKEQWEQVGMLRQYINNEGFYDVHLEPSVQDNPAERARVLETTEVQVLDQLKILEQQLEYRGTGGARARAKRYLAWRRLLSRRYPS